MKDLQDITNKMLKLAEEIPTAQDRAFASINENMNGVDDEKKKQLMSFMDRIKQAQAKGDVDALSGMLAEIQNLIIK